MDTKSYLMNQGWSGPGNPLNPARRPGGPHAGLGLSKPILVSRKQNTFGVGKKATHDHTNQWWLRGFEEALRGVGTDGSATPSSTTTTPAGETSEGRESELYKFFVRGQELPGTINSNLRRESGDGSATIQEEEGKRAKKRKRKTDEQVSEKKSLKREERKKRKAAKRIESVQVSHDDEEDVAAQKSAVKLRKKSRDKKQRRRPQDSVSSEHADNEGAESSGDEKLKKRKKRKRRKDDSVLGTVGADSLAEDVTNGTTKPAILDKDERKKLKAAKKATEESRISKGKDKESKRSKKKSAKDGN